MLLALIVLGAGSGFSRVELNRIVSGSFAPIAGILLIVGGRGSRSPRTSIHGSGRRPTWTSSSGICAASPEYGSDRVCEQYFGKHPVQVCFDWNTAAHAQATQSAPVARHDLLKSRWLTYEVELQLQIDYPSLSDGRNATTTDS